MDNSFKPAILNYAGGSAIVVEGTPHAERFFIVQKGKVRIMRDIDLLIEKKQNVAVEGDIIGVVSAMSGYSYIETLLALTDVVLLEVRRGQYTGLIRNNLDVAGKIVRQFSQRQRELFKVFSCRALSTAALDNSAHILQVADYYAGQKKFNHAFYAYRQYIIDCPDAPDLQQIRQKMTEITPHLKVQNLRIQYLTSKIERRYPKDSLIFAEGEKGDELYIIVEGTVNITKIIDNKEILLSVLTRGDIFGEMSLLEDKPRAATAEVTEDCIVFAVNRENFETVSRIQPDLIARLTSAMAEHIWLISKRIATTLMEDPLGRMYNALLVQLEKERVALDTNQSHQCSFGFRELSGMAGIPAAEGENLGRKMLLGSRIRLVNGKIFVADTLEVKRQTDYYLRLQKINQSK
jgi:CRP-like cAMP-binding protein